MKIQYFSLVILFAANSAFAGSIYSCGKDKGDDQKAEIFFSESLEGYKLRVSGKEISAEDFEVKPADESWIITVYGKKNEHDRKFVFSEKSNSVNEFLLSEDNREKKVGNEKSCAVSATKEND